MANLKHAENEHSPAKASEGRAAAATGTVPSFAAASELLSAPYSCLVLSRHRRHVALPPVYLSKKRTGIQEELDAEMLKFSPSLHGVPLAYDNIRIAAQHGDIYDDSGYIHMNVEANFIVFQPKKGQKLLGKVNKLGVSHVGCLVHGCFNASIPKPSLVSMETWRDAGPRIGTELEFKVTTLDADAVGVLLIRGLLDRTRVQELMAQSENMESNITTDQQEPVPGLTDCYDGAPKKKKKKKKKKEKERLKDEEMEEEITRMPGLHRLAAPALNGSADETNGGDTPEKKKKKKKEKHVKEEEEQMGVSGLQSQSSFNDKPGKKRKLESDEPTVDDPSPKKLKKKKRSEV